MQPAATTRVALLPSLPSAAALPGGGGTGEARQIVTARMAANVVSAAVPSTATLERESPRPAAQRQGEELEKLEARTVAAEMTLASLEEEVRSLRRECQRGKEQQRQLAKALEDSIPTGDHYQILRAMSQDHLAAACLWDQRGREVDAKYRTAFEQAALRLQESLLAREGQLADFRTVGSELQRAGAGQRALEERSSRLTDQLQQLTSVQAIVGERQAQVEIVQNQAFEYWRELQGKLWEVDELRAKGEALKLQWQTLKGTATSQSGTFAPASPASVAFASPARHLFLAHLDAVGGTRGDLSASSSRAASPARVRGAAQLADGIDLVRTPQTSTSLSLSPSPAAATISAVAAPPASLLTSSSVASVPITLLGPAVPLLTSSARAQGASVATKPARVLSPPHTAPPSPAATS